MHIDSENELPTQEQPLIEEPDDQEQGTQQQEENPQAAPDLAPEAPSDPSEEGKQDHAIPTKVILFKHLH